MNQRGFHPGAQMTDKRVNLLAFQCSTPGAQRGFGLCHVLLLAAIGGLIWVGAFMLLVRC